MENTMGNDMDSTNPTTGFSFINDSLFIDDSSLVFDAYFRTYLLLAEAGSKVFDFLTSAAVAAYLSALRYVPVSKLPAHILSTPSCPACSYAKKEATHQNDVWRKSELYSGKIHFPDGFSGYIVPSVSHICQWSIELFFHLC